MEFFYDRHKEEYHNFLNNKEKSKIADSWRNIYTLDYWRHNRMLSTLKPLIEKDDKWLTIGDGRFGSESAWLKKNGIHSHASDMHTSFLQIAFDKGLIDSYSQQNAEKLKFKSNSFDYVLIKETFHHLPRPWLAIYEAYRVCKKAVVIIEPIDSYYYGNFLSKIFVKLKNILKFILKKNVFKEEYNFESVGNFIYTINYRELEKFLLGMHKTSIAHKNINDHYFKNIEFISTKNNNLKEKIICLNLKIIIFLKNILCFLGIFKYSIGEVILFKNNPQKELIKKLKNKNWKYKKLPKNPYL